MRLNVFLDEQIGRSNYYFSKMFYYVLTGFQNYLTWNIRLIIEVTLFHAHLESPMATVRMSVIDQLNTLKAADEECPYITYYFLM